MFLVCPCKRDARQGEIKYSYMLTCTCSQIPAKLSHDGWRTLRGSQRRLSPNGAQPPGMAALMIGRLHARFAENASARWCRAKGAACRDTFFSYARAHIAERLGGSERDTVLHLAKASVPRPRLLQLSRSALQLPQERRLEYLHPMLRQMSGYPSCIRCRKKKARCSVFCVVACESCCYLLPSASLMDAIHFQFTLYVHLAAVCTRLMSCQSAS